MLKRVTDGSLVTYAKPINKDLISDPLPRGNADITQISHNSYGNAEITHTIITQVSQC